MEYKNLDMNPVEYHKKNYWKVKHNLVAQLTKGEVVDLGCGWFSNPYLVDAVGVDIEKMSCPKNYKKLIQADLNGKIPLPDNSFDTVIASGVIEHLYNYHGFLIECKRILKPGGTFIVNTPNKTVNRLIARKNMLHVQEWNISDFKDLLKHFFVYKQAYGLVMIIPLIRWEVNLKRFPILSHDIVYVCKKK